MDTGTCDRWTDRLSDYLDGELAPREAAKLEAHLAGCGNCAQLLRELRAVVATAANLEDALPAHELWPGIEARLEEALQLRAPLAAATEPAGVISLAGHRRRFSFSLPQLAAAGVALVALSSTVVWLVTARAGSPVQAARTVAAALPAASASPEARRPAGGNAAAEPPSEAPGSPAPSATEALAPGQPATSAESRRGAAASGARFVRNDASALEADRQYDRAVADLERLLRRERARLRPETVQALEKSLADIDQAITEARRALARDPANMYLNDHLAESMRLKLELLRQATALAQS